MRRTTRIIAALIAVCWTAIACLVSFAPPAQATGSHAVVMANYAFAPSAITVHVGDSVSWTNHDQAPHNIVTTDAPQSINSPMLSNGQSWSYSFTTPGTYHYICGVHPDMRGSVVVLPAPAAMSRPSATSSPPHAAVHSHPASAAAMPAMPAMASGHSSHSAPSAHSSSPSHPAEGATSPAIAAGGSASAAATPVAAVSSGGITSARLKPLLLVAGVIAAVTVFCLLALASRPDPPTD